MLFIHINTIKLKLETFLTCLEFVIMQITERVIPLNVFVIFFFPFLSFLATLQHMEFPGQGSDVNNSCDPYHSCGSAGSLTYCAGPGTPNAPETLLISLSHSRNSSIFFKIWVKDLALLHLWHRSQLLLRFAPWPRNFHMPQGSQKRRKKKF